MQYRSHRFSYTKSNTKTDSRFSITLSAVFRSIWYSVLLRVWLGATTIKSPVWTPRGSKFWATHINGNRVQQSVVVVGGGGHHVHFNSNTFIPLGRWLALNLNITLTLTLKAQKGYVEKAYSGLYSFCSTIMTQYAQIKRQPIRKSLGVFQCLHAKSTNQSDILKGVPGESMS